MPLCSGEPPKYSSMQNRVHSAAVTSRSSSAEVDARQSWTAPDRAAGRCSLQGEGADVQSEARPGDGGWSVAVPVAGRGMPSRVVVSLEGYAATRAAFW